MSDAVTISLIGAIFSFMTTALGLYTQALTRRNERGISEAKDSINSTNVSVAENTKAVEATKVTIVALEKNTNNIHDALLKVTGEKEFARGMEIGIGVTRDGSITPGVSALVQDAKVKAAHSEGVAKGMADERNKTASTEPPVEPIKEKT